MNLYEQIRERYPCRSCPPPAAGMQPEQLRRVDEMVPPELEAGFELLGKEGCALNNQEKKTYLKRYGKADRELDVLYEELALWRSKEEKITSALRQTPGGSQVETAVEKILAAQKEIYMKIEELMALSQEVVDAIQTVPDETLQLLLSYRYILGMTFEQIAVRMHYNYRWILRLHERALSAVQLDETIGRDA